MAYNRVNFLNRIIQMQELVLSIQATYEGVYLKEIYWQHIYPKYGISYRTFHTWLGINAKAELKKELEKQNKKQLKLF